MTRVLIGHVAAFLSLGLHDCLNDEGVEQVPEPTDPEALYEAVLERLPDVVVVGLDNDGAPQLAERLSSQFPATRVIACSAVRPMMRVYPAFHRGEFYVTPLDRERFLEAVGR